VRAGDDGNCGQTAVPTAYDLLHAAICRLNGAGVTTVVAAGNYKQDLATEPRVPAAYGEVITVGAICDSDGVAGGTGAACRSDAADDAWAGFSNWGAQVDLVAPGALIWSTMPGPGYGYKDGTSLATPHVAGGAALYHLREAQLGRPRPTPEQVRAGLIAAAKHDWRVGTYPLGSAAAPPLLDVASLSPAPGFGISATPAARRAGAGASVFFDVALGRYGGFTGDITLDVSGLPAGAAWAAAGGATVAADGERWQRLTIELPTSGGSGTYDVVIGGGAEDVASQAATVKLQYEGTFSVGPLPRLNLLGGTVSGVPFKARVAWPAVKGAQRYELQYSNDEGPWQAITLRRALTRRVGFSAWPGTSYRFRMRVLRNGVWEAWQTSKLYVVTPEMALDDGVTLTGAWSGYSPKKGYSEVVTYSSQANARMSFDFVGRSVAWLATRGPDRGKAAVYIDGSRVATVDLYAKTTKFRRIVFRRSWPDAAAHRLEIVLLGTAGRPRVDIDAVVYISAN